MAEGLNEPSQPTTSRKNWTDEETVELICLWSDDIIQEELEGPRNKLVFEKISKSLNNKGYKRTTGQCRDKIKKLKKDYRKVKDNNNVTGTKRKTCKFYEELDAILSVKPATSPSVCISSEQGIVTNKDELSEGDTEEPLDESNESLNDNPVEPGAIGSINSPSSSVSDNSSVIIKRRCDQNNSTAKRRKPATKLEKSLELVIGKFMDGQMELESKFLELEEKRMMMEMEMEKKRIEMEEKRWERERYHDMNMWQMLQHTTRGSFPFAPPNNNTCMDFSAFNNGNN